MQFIPLSVSGAYEILLPPRRDERGMFARLFCQKEFAGIGFHRNIDQINQSVNTAKGTIRGMHFQKSPHAEIKIIRCIKGKVFDVLVDLRRGSPTLLKWAAVELTPDKWNMVFIPEGCAHGFQTLEPDSELLYFHAGFYHSEAEGAIRFDDARAGIKWPLPPAVISPRDQTHPLLDTSFEGIEF